ncbi:kinase-like protein [Suillus decipiens]|nr:kinase-like protein [Suillus decipiens]
MLKTVGAPLKGHTRVITGLALSPDCLLLASSSHNTIKLWTFESRQLLASFDVKAPMNLVLSPDSRQLAYTTLYVTKIHICNIPPNIFARIGLAEELQPNIFLQTGHSAPSNLPRLGPDPFELLPSSPHINTVSSASKVKPDNPSPETLRDLLKYITKDGDYPVTRGGFGEIWKCTFHTNRSSVKVAVKALQVYYDDQFGPAKAKKIKPRPCKHPACYTYGFGPFIAIVSPWAENGNLTVYLEREGAALTLVLRFQILRDIIAGLQYLYANSVIHDDFTGSNVLIYGNGTACVADFGLSLMYSEIMTPSQASWTSSLKGNMRWMAPKLLVEREDGSQVRPSEQSDMYSFGGIMLQVLTNKLPYYHLTNDAAIVLCIAKSQTPFRTRYPELPEKYWPLIEQCWSTDPRDRPSTEGADVRIRNEYYSLSRSR